MRLHIEGKHTGLAPHLLGWIAERLQALNTPEADILEAWVTLVQQKHQEVARVQLQVAGKLLQVTQRGATPDAAIDAALQMVQRALHEVRATRRLRTAMPLADETALPMYAASTARQT
jgi:ribosome-associated translation inhibitor RaiA